MTSPAAPAPRAGRSRSPLQPFGDTSRAIGGMVLLSGIVAVMWFVEVVNTVDSNGLDSDGIYARNVGRLWGILTSPFIHASFQHLIGNTVPFVFLGVIIAMRGARRLALVTAFVIVIGGFGTWLISPSHDAAGQAADTIGASGVVFGYATYLLTRGLFDRSLMELLVGVAVGVIWGGVLVASLEPHQGVSWQAHACGAVAGVIVAARLSAVDGRGVRRRGRDRGPGPGVSGASSRPASGPATP